MGTKRWDEKLADTWDLAAETVFADRPDVAMAYRMCAAELRQHGYAGERYTATLAVRGMRRDCFNLADTWRTRACGLEREAREEVVFCARELENEVDGPPGRRVERDAKGR